MSILPPARNPRHALSPPDGRSRLPVQGWSVEETLDRLEALRGGDVRWREGRVFSLAYHADAGLHELAGEAYRRYSGENALNMDAFPSLRAMQSEILAIAAGWLAAPAGARGFLTSGGTESILMAVKAARDQFRARGVTRPNVVLPTSAHAAFEKAGAYFDVEMRRVAVGPDWRADSSAMAAAGDADTVMFVASAPQYPQGVVDPVGTVAALAVERSVNCHVDACMGGVTLPYLERLGVEIPPWNFEVEGVTSISVDLHKYGYTAKGASVVMYRDATLRSFQGFVTDNWLGGTYGSSGMLGTKSGGPIAAAWAVLHHLGDEGYLHLAERARQAALRVAKAIADDPRLVLRAQPDSTLLSFGSADPAVNIFAVADRLAVRGWYVDRQSPPDSLHLTVNAGHHSTVEEFIDDLRRCLDEAPDGGGSAGAYGTME